MGRFQGSIERIITFTAAMCVTGKVVTIDPFTAPIKVFDACAEAMSAARKSDLFNQTVAAGTNNEGDIVCINLEWTSPKLRAGPVPTKRSDFPANSEIEHGLARSISRCDDMFIAAVGYPCNGEK